jgi:chemotaxis protein CheD
VSGERVVVPMGQLAVKTAPLTLAALGLGSCVAVMLYDRVATVGGMAHVLLPAGPAGAMRANPARYAQSAVPALVDAVLAAGGHRPRLTARLAGGATMFANLVAPGLISIGERNTLAVREGLDALGIRVAGELVGGDHGRTVVFDLSDGRVRITSVRHGSHEL